jgi:hypothetical protein
LEGSGTGLKVSPEDVYIRWKDLDPVLDRSYERSGIKGEIASLKKDVRFIKKTCKKRAQICPALNIDAKIAYDKKVREAKQEDEMDQQEFRQKVKLSDIKFLGIQAKAWIAVVIGAALALIVGAGGVYAALKGI